MPVFQFRPPVQDLLRRGHNIRSDFHNNHRDLGIMADDQTTAGAVRSLTKQLHALSVKLDPFKGSDTENVEDFIKDFTKYVTSTGQTEEEDKKQVLQSHLKESAKEWWKLQDDTKTTADLLQLLNDHFKLTEHAKHARIVKIYGMVQRDDETYLEFVSSVRSKSRFLGLNEASLVAICISGAKPNIKPHLAMQKPNSFENLLNLPVAKDESLCAPPAVPLVNIVQETHVKDTVQNKKSNTIQDSDNTHMDTGQNGRSVDHHHTHTPRTSYIRDNSPTPGEERLSSGDEYRETYEPRRTYGGSRRYAGCAHQRYCFHGGTQPLNRPPPLFRGSNRMTWYEWDRRNEPHNSSFRGNYQNYNEWDTRNWPRDFSFRENYQDYNNYRKSYTMPNNYYNGNNDNFIGYRAPAYGSQNFNRNDVFAYRNQGDTNLYNDHVHSQ